MKLCALLLAAMLCTLCVGQASALEYTMNAPDDYLFGRPTSDDTIYEWENPNVDRSKNTALIPPTFGSPTSYLPGTGTPLTPNLIPGALTGGGLVTQTGGVTYPTVGGSPGGNSGAGSAATGWTDVTGDLYYSGGHLGTLKIPAIGLSTKVYQGTGSSVLAKGAGHFLDTSIWAGNVCIAGHNRGVRDDFGDLHTLEPGDTVTWTTKLGTRTYEVVSVQKVLETDTSGTTATSDDRLTLYTCVRDQREYRWCVTAVPRSDALSPAAPFLSAAEEMGAAARWGQHISPEKSCSQNVYTFGQRKSKITIDKSAKRAILWSRSKKGKVKIDFVERWKASMGISDLIAGFIQQELDEAGGALELQRSDLAQRFNCVPSQINYVMSTRFSPEHGYIVESRRGGGGYIRITRVQVDRQTLLMHVINTIGDTLDYASARAITQNLVDSEAISRELGQSMLAATGERALRSVPKEQRSGLRADIFKQILIHSV